MRSLVDTETTKYWCLAASRKCTKRTTFCGYSLMSKVYISCHETRAAELTSLAFLTKTSTDQATKYDWKPFHFTTRLDLYTITSSHARTTRCYNLSCVMLLVTSNSH